MMESRETAKLKAVGKLKLSAVVLVLLILMGVGVEYHRMNAPLDEATIVYAKVSDKSEIGDKGGKVEPAAEVKESQEKLVESTAIVELVDYLNDVNARVNGAEKKPSVLDKIEALETDKEGLLRTDSSGLVAAPQVTSATDVADPRNDGREGDVEVTDVHDDGGASVAEVVSEEEVDESVDTVDVTDEEEFQLVPVEQDKAVETPVVATPQATSTTEIGVLRTDSSGLPRVSATDVADPRNDGREGGNAVQTTSESDDIVVPEAEAEIEKDAETIAKAVQAIESIVIVEDGKQAKVTENAAEIIESMQEEGAIDLMQGILKGEIVAN